MSSTVSPTTFRLTREQAATVLNCSTKTIDRYVKKGLLSSQKISGRIYLSVDEAESWRQQRAGKINFTITNLNPLDENEIGENGQFEFTPAEQNGQNGHFGHEVDTLDTEWTTNGQQNGHVDIDEMAYDSEYVEERLKQSGQNGHISANKSHKFKKPVQSVQSVQSDGKRGVFQQTEWGSADKKVPQSGRPRKVAVSDTYKELYLATKGDLADKQKRLESATYRIGQLEAQLSASVPLLDYSRKEAELKETKQDLDIEVKDLQHKLEREYLNKLVYIILVFFLLLLGTAIMFI